MITLEAYDGSPVQLGKKILIARCWISAALPPQFRRRGGGTAAEVRQNLPGTALRTIDHPVTPYSLFCFGEN